MHLNRWLRPDRSAGPLPRLIARETIEQPDSGVHVVADPAIVNALDRERGER